MNGIQGAASRNIPQAQADNSSRRPGTLGHPGKHLGQMKKAEKMHPANVKLVNQQIEALANSKGNGNAGKAGGGTDNQLTDTHFQSTLDYIRDSGDAVADAIRFNSRMSSIGLAFF